MEEFTLNPKLIQLHIKSTVWKKFISDDGICKPVLLWLQSKAMK